MFKLIPLFAALCSTIAYAADAPNPDRSYTFVIGPSAPSKKVNVLQPGINLIRRSGGEYVYFTFLDSNLNDSQQTMTGLQITAYSKSGRGSILVHDTSLSPTDEPTELKKLLGKLNAGKTSAVTFSRPLPVRDLNFQIEGFGDDDASVAIMITLARSVNFKYRATEDYVNPPESSGGGGYGGGNGGGETYRDQCFASPGHFGCSDRGPGSLYDQAGCEANPGSFECQGG